MNIISMFALLATTTSAASLRGNNTVTISTNASTSIGHFPCDIGADRTIQASDGMTLGFRILEPKTYDLTVFILPGYTLTATQNICWFGPALEQALSNVRIVALDYRGFGLSQGKLTPSTPPDVSDSGSVYTGLRMSRLAKDVSEVMARGIEHFDPAKTVLLGHSMGNAVLFEHLSLFATNYRGFAIIDQPATFHRKPSPADVTFDTALPFFDKNWTAAAEGSVYHAIPVQVNTAPTSAHYHYPQVGATYFKAFKSVEHCHMIKQAYNNGTQPTEFDKGCLQASCCVTQTESGLKQWAAGTHNFTDINGKVDELLQWSDSAQDYTDVISLIRDVHLPVFVYGGEHSLNPVSDMEWMWDVVRSGSPKSQKLIFYGSEGVHTPFLNKPLSRARFFKELTRWIRRL